MARDAPSHAAAGHGHRSVIGGATTGELPIEVLAPVTTESIAAHVLDVHRWPRHVVEDTPIEHLMAWHSGEHHALDAPTDPNRTRPPVHLLHRHDPKAHRTTPARSPIPRKPLR